jgi:hypothetical protein
MATFGTLLVMYLLLGWMPSLLVAMGLSQPQAQYVQMLFNIGVQLAQSNALMQMVTLTSSPEFEKALDGSVPTSQDTNNQELNKE